MPLKNFNRIFFDANAEGGGGTGVADPAAPTTTPENNQTSQSSGPPEGLLASAGVEKGSLENDPNAMPPEDKDVQAPPGDIAERPQNIAEQFWDSETGKPKVDALSKSYNDLRKQFNQLVQDKGAAPEDFKAYLEDFKPPFRTRATGDQTEGDVMERYGQIDAEDPVFQVLAKAAKGADMKEGKFQDFVQDIMEGLHHILPEKMDRILQAKSLRSRLSDSLYARRSIPYNYRYVAKIIVYP